MGNAAINFFSICLQLSSTSSASIFVNAGLTHFEPSLRQPSTFSGISPRALPTVPENETTTPIEEAPKEPASLPHIPLTTTFMSHKDIHSTFDPFISMEHHPFQDDSHREKQPSPRVDSMFSGQLDPFAETPLSLSEHSKQSAAETKPDPLSNVKPVVYDNPWDFVPDQPNINVLTGSVNSHQGKS